jgi:hypothetical protein
MNIEQVKKYRQGMWLANDAGLKRVLRDSKDRISGLSFLDFEKNVNFYTEFSDILSILYCMHFLVFRDHFHPKAVLMKDHRNKIFKYSMYLGVSTKSEPYPEYFLLKYNLNEKYQLRKEEVSGVMTFKHGDMYDYNHTEDIEILITDFTGGILQ